MVLPLPIWMKKASSSDTPANAPSRQRAADCSLDPGPEKGVVRLEYGPAGIPPDAFLDIDKEPADVDVFPGSVVRQGARSPNADTASGDIPDQVDPMGVEQILLRFAKADLQSGTAAERFIGGRFMDSTGLVAAGVHPSD